MIESIFGFPEFVPKNQFIPSVQFWDTVNFRVRIVSSRTYAFFLRFFINSYLCEKLLRHDFFKQMLVQNELIFNEINEMNEAWIWQYIFLGERGVSHDVDVILERVVT